MVRAWNDRSINDWNSVCSTGLLAGCIGVVCVGIFAGRSPIDFGVGWFWLAIAASVGILGKDSLIILEYLKAYIIHKLGLDNETGDED